MRQSRYPVINTIFMCMNTRHKVHTRVGCRTLVSLHLPQCRIIPVLDRTPQ